MSLSVTQVELTQPAPADASRASPETTRELVIRSRKGWNPIDWRELLSHRELLFFLIWRDVKVKYKQAILGFAWAILVPVIQVVLFTFIGNAAGFNSKTSAPYALYVYAGLLPWLFLSSSITNGGLSLVNQQSLLSKIYLPRLFIPAATIGTALIDMLLSGAVFATMFAWYGFPPSSNVVYLPLLMLLLITLGLGSAFILSALTINYRDVRFLIPFLAQVLMWISAAVYPPRIFNPQQMGWLDFNPVYGVICGFRTALLGEPLQLRALVVSIIFSAVLLVWGSYYFKKAERRFADIA
ncbi:MAG: ABC transporter permease [Phycisphaerae bacterium]|nr:ABC transporter permease [Phycisphaerae bacterium]MDW8260898.1 ABC transporter permease [Phycisphaerales bacterium]